MKILLYLMCFIRILLTLFFKIIKYVSQEHIYIYNQLFYDIINNLYLFFLYMLLT